MEGVVAVGGCSVIVGEVGTVEGNWGLTLTTGVTVGEVVGRAGGGTVGEASGNGADTQAVKVNVHKDKRQITNSLRFSIALCSFMASSGAAEVMQQTAHCMGEC